MRPGGRNRLGRRGSARLADRPLDRAAPGHRRRPARRGRHSRLCDARSVPRRVAGPWRRRARLGRVEDQRRAGVRARDGRFAGYRGIALRDLPARPRRTGRRSCPIRIRCESWFTRSRLRSMPSSASPRSSTANSSAPPTSLPRTRRGYRFPGANLLGAIDDLDFAAKVHSAPGEGRRVDLAELLDRAAELARARPPPATSRSRSDARSALPPPPSSRNSPTD